MGKMKFSKKAELYAVYRGIDNCKLICLKFTNIVLQFCLSYNFVVLCRYFCRYCFIFADIVKLKSHNDNFGITLKYR